MLISALLFTQSNLQAQKCCVECQADVKVVSDKQVLLEKIDLKAGTLTTYVNTNLYVSYRSGNSQKFWTNLVIATAGVAVSTQLSNGNLAEGKGANGISPLLPLGVSVATLPSIWKNRPRNVPQAGLYIQHRDTRGKLLETWEQPISSEAKNDAELLTVTIVKPLSAGTLEVYLQNGSKNGVYYWGYETTSKSKKSDNTIIQNPPVALSTAGCPDGYLPNGNGMCCNPFTGNCMSEGGGNPPTTTQGNNPPTTKTETRITSTTSTANGSSGGCPNGYLPDGQGQCCHPFTGECVFENQTSGGVVCITATICTDYYYRVCTAYDCGEWTYNFSDCTSSTSCTNIDGGGSTDGGGGGTGSGGTGNGGTGNGSGGTGGGGGGGSGTKNPVVTPPDPWKIKQQCLKRASDESRFSKNLCQMDFNNAWNNSSLAIWGLSVAAGTLGGTAGAAGCTFVLPIVGTVACGGVGAAIGFIGGLTIGYTTAYFNIGDNLDLCINNADIRYQQAVRDCN